MELTEYAALDAIGIAEAVRGGGLSPAEVADAARRAITLADPAVGAVIELFDEPLGAPIGTSTDAALSGVPFLIKDVGATLRGVGSEAGSRLAAGLTGERDSKLVRTLLRAGLQLLGRSATSEFALLTHTDTALHGPTRTPWSPAHSAGGSSAGAAAAVAAGLVPVAHGNDGGGSLRIPASACGVIGLKPTRGSISLRPHSDVGFGWVNEFMVTRTVRDTVALFDLLAEPRAASPVPSARPLRVGYWVHPWSGVAGSSEVAGVAVAAAAKLEEWGSTVSEASPRFDWDAFAEAQFVLFAVLHRYAVNQTAAATGRTPGPDNLEPHTLAVHHAARNLDASAVLRALELADVVREQLAVFFDDFDLLITPTMPDLPDAFERAAVGRLDDGPDEIKQLWASRGTFTDPFNLSGNPAISLPLGWSSTGLPIGVQLVGRWASEPTLLAYAERFEQALPWAGRRPPLHVAAVAAALTRSPGH
jgi:amidase